MFFIIFCGDRHLTMLPMLDVFKSFHNTKYITYIRTHIHLFIIYLFIWDRVSLCSGRTVVTQSRLTTTYASQVQVILMSQLLSSQDYRRGSPPWIIFVFLGETRFHHVARLVSSGLKWSSHFSLPKFWDYNKREPPCPACFTTSKNVYQVVSSVTEEIHLPLLQYALTIWINNP